MLTVLVLLQGLIVSWAYKRTSSKEILLKQCINFRRFGAIGLSDGERIFSREPRCCLAGTEFCRILTYSDFPKFAIAGSKDF